MKNRLSPFPTPTLTLPTGEPEQAPAFRATPDLLRGLWECDDKVPAQKAGTAQSLVSALNHSPMQALNLSPLRALILSSSKEAGDTASWFDKLTMRPQVLAHAVGPWLKRLTMSLQVLAHAVGPWLNTLAIRCV